MFRKSESTGRRFRIPAMAGAVLMVATLAWAQQAGPDEALAGWLGQELTVASSTINDHMPVGGKLTFIFDSSAWTSRPPRPGNLTSSTRQLTASGNNLPSSSSAAATARE